MNKMTSRLNWLTVVGCCVATMFGQTVIADDDGPTLVIGSPAPAIDIENWVSDRDGAMEHVTELKADKVYVIEFWATWCGPCIASMPHLSETQDKFEDDVQIISVTREPLETVEEFLKKEVRGESDKTYAQLTSNYCLTSDPDESVYKEYFRAAGESGIPSAFIVGKTGLIEWIGHPMKMDEPLQQVVDGKWDRDAFLEERKEKQKLELAKRKLSKQIRGIMQLAEEGETKEAIEKLDDLLQADEHEWAKPKIEQIRTTIMVGSDDDEVAKQAFSEYVEKNKDDAYSVLGISRAVLSNHMENGNVSDELRQAAIEAAESILEAEPKNEAAMFTLSQWYHAQGDVEKAVETLEKAIENDGRMTAMFKRLLNEIKAEQKEQAESTDDDEATEKEAADDEDEADK